MENETTYEEMPETVPIESVPEDVPESVVEVVESSETNSFEDSETVSTDEVGTTEEETTTEEMTENDSINSNDSISSNNVVLMSDAPSDYSTQLSYISHILQDQRSLLREESIPFFEKPFANYTVSEGLLLLIFVLMFGTFLYGLVERR